MAPARVGNLSQDLVAIKAEGLVRPLLARQTKRKPKVKAPPAAKSAGEELIVNIIRKDSVILFMPTLPLLRRKRRTAGTKVRESRETDRGGSSP